MFRRKAVLGLVMFSLVAILGSCLALAQEGQGERGGRRRERRTPEQRQARTLNMVKEAIEAGDDDWKALGPKVGEVMTLQRQSAVGGMRMLFRAGRGGRRPADTERERSDIEKLTEELQKILENKDAAATDIKAKLKELREAREKVKVALDKARTALRELVTQRQEAKFVLFGILN